MFKQVRIFQHVRIDFTRIFAARIAGRDVRDPLRGRGIRPILLALWPILWMLAAFPAQAITKANFDKVSTTFQWETATTVISGLACDDCTQQIDIGFDFPFAGERFNKVYVSSNGLMSLLASVTAYNNSDLPTSSIDKNTSALIMPYWDDLYPGRGGNITYAVLGSAPNRRLVVSWNAIPHYSDPGIYSFQAILYESGEIKFQYGSGNANGASATVGIEVTNDDYIKHSYNSASLTPGSTALLFRPQPYVQSVIQSCGSSNSLIVLYSYPMNAASAGRKQNYDFASSSTPGLNVISANLSADGYTATLTLNKDLQKGGSYQLRITDAQSPAGRAINPNPTTRPISGSSGLIGTYYSQYGIQRAYHSGPWVQRNDAQVNFSWNTGVPDILPRGDDFSTRWEGYLIPSRSGNYVFRTYSDDGIRLWVNGMKILDAWNDHAPRYDNSTSINLSAGVAVPMVLEHYERGGQAYAQLYWDEPDGTSGNYALVPSSALSPCPSTPTGPDHIRIEHDGNGLTCQAERITLKACADATCSTEYTGDVTVDLAANNGGTSSPNPVTFNGHTDVQLSKTTAGDTTLSIASATPSAVNDWDCVVNGTLVSQAACKVNFADAGFVFDVPNLTACETSPSVTLRAVKKDDSSTSCAPAFTGDRTVRFWSTYVNPDSGSQAISVNGNAVATASPGTPLSLNFNSSGEATFTVSYPDVGRMQLDVRYDGSSATQDAGLVMTGSDQFVARPDHFDLTRIQCADGTSNPGASDASGARFCRAGQDFKVEVKAVCADGRTTPNFGHELPAESVKLSSQQVAPAGVAPVTLRGGMAAFGTDCAGNSAPGVACGTFQWGEVGIITLTPSIADGDYLGTGDVSGRASGNVGRFYPHHFDTQVTDGCTGFTYSGQPFGLKVLARNSSGETTLNYAGSFAKDVSLANVTGTSGQFTRDGSTCSACVMASDFSAGEASLLSPKRVAFEFANKTTAPAILKVRANDTDTGAASGLAEGETVLRAGRMTVARAHSYLETQPVSIPVVTEFYDGTTFKRNDLDQCTNLTSSAIRLDSDQETNQTDGNIAVGVGGSTNMSVPNGGAFSSGTLTLGFSAPGAPNNGFTDITPQLGSMPWLRYDWDGDGVHDDDPKGRASWGMYRGNRNVIYLRERWN